MIIKSFYLIKKNLKIILDMKKNFEKKNKLKENFEDILNKKIWYFSNLKLNIL